MLLRHTPYSLFLFLLLSGPFSSDAVAQMMPQQEETSDAPSAPAKAETPVSGFLGHWEKYMGEESPYRGVVLSIITLIILSMIYKHSTTAVRKVVDSNSFHEKNAVAFMKSWKSIWKFVIGVMTVIALSGSLKLLGLSAGFLGMMLGWSLQAPVTGIAAWVMLIVKKPFRIGDRIILAGYTGDVTEITLTHVILNQVGGTVGGEERSGRGILIPNAMLFGQVIINYTLEQKYMLDEVAVRLTFNSDYELAEKLCLEAAQIGLPKEVIDAGHVPSIRCELYEHGILLRVRYQTIPAERQMISTVITRSILSKFKENYDAVRFCYPHSVVRYRQDFLNDDELPMVAKADD